MERVFEEKQMDDPAIECSTISRLEEAQLRHALEQSVRLQAHYARVLNDYDGGKRIAFGSAVEWIERLRELNQLYDPRRRQVNNAHDRH